MANHFKRLAQNPVLPWELTDIIIDFLHDDVRALGVCGAVCSEWLIRSRYHIFSRVQLWPWRMRRFVALANDIGCTFNNFITRIEMDDARVKLAGKICGGQFQSRIGSHAEGQGYPGGVAEENMNIMFNEAMAHSEMKSFSQVNAIQIRNVDWTSLSPAQRASLRTQLSKLSRLRHLEFHDVVFHDVREVARILRSLGPLHHLTANISFLKYLEYNLALTANHNITSSELKSLEVTTDEGIPVLLSCITNPGEPHQTRVQTMTLRNVEEKHLQHIRNTLKTSGKHLHQLNLNFKREKVSLVSEDDLDFANLHELRTLSIGGIQLSSSTSRAVIERSLPKILGQIDAPFFTTLEVSLHLEAAISAEEMVCIDWSHLQRVLLHQHFFGLSTIRIVIEASAVSLVDQAWCMERKMRAGLVELLSRGALDLQVVCERAVAGVADDVGDKE